MPVFRPSTTDALQAREALDALAASEAVAAGQVALPAVVIQGLEKILRFTTAGDPFTVDVRTYVPPEERPQCADCGEPVELACEDDPTSWIHTEEANYFGDHTASFAEAR